MIPRILVPKNVQPASVSPTAPPRRLSSVLDVRKFVPSDLPQIELDTRTSIPSYFHLEVLGSTIVVPRDMPITPLDVTSKTPDYVPMAILGTRVAVPRDAHPAYLQPKAPVAIQDLPDVLDPDVITTGEVNLMTRHVEDQTAAWNSVSHLVSAGYIALVTLLALFGPGRNAVRQNITAATDDQNINYLFAPPDLKELMSRPAPPKPPSVPAVHVDPRILRQLTPPRVVQPSPAPQEPERALNDTPSPQLAKPSPIAPPQEAKQDSPIRTPAPLPDTPTPSITLPHFSPGKALEDSLHAALKDGGTPSVQFGGPISPSPVPGRGGPGGYPGGGGGQGGLGGSVEMLTPTQGVDFTPYLNRVIDSIRRNWYAVMPESVYLGDRGRVAMEFEIMQNGVVPESEPVMVAGSGKDPLDRAAFSSIRASTPFEPLPSAFSGPSIKLRITYLYNIPLNSQ
jgi:outer membrane biosynthesis protein TonB